MNQEFSAERVPVTQEGREKGGVNVVPSAVRQALSDAGQEHLIDCLQSLPANARESLQNQISQIEWGALSFRSTAPDLKAIQESNVLTINDQKAQRAELQRIGVEAFRDGSVGFLLMAGGQGTRLEVSIPKGCFSIGAVSQKTLYEIHAEKVLALSERYGKEFPLLIMTSPSTDAETRAFFKENNNFSLPERQIRFFCQSTVPSMEIGGKAIVNDASELVLNPDGHGGCFGAIHKSGNLTQLFNEGVKHLLYCQIDNPLIVIDDPEFVGLAIRDKCDMLTKVVQKANSEEKVGHLVSLDGTDRMVEYIELTPEQRKQTTETGELRFRWGNVAAHYFNVDWLLDRASSGLCLPFHESRKFMKVEIDGEEVSQEIVKLERFIFDLLPLTSSHRGVEILREEQFAPVKNSEGVDSPETARKISSDLYANWLRRVGVEVILEPGNYIEISPRYAQTEREFRQKWDGRVDRITESTLIELEERGVSSTLE